ncbi:MAG: hypothetical protein WCT05_10115 [Lentisphaeria bacterium]
MSVNEFKQRYFNAVMDLLWRQWSRLGIAGQMNHDGASYVLDPEALLIFSAWFSRYDQRLYDLILDWLKVNGAFINIQRLKSLAEKNRHKDISSLGYIAAQMHRLEGRRWKKLADDYLPETPLPPVPMFTNMNHETTSFCRLKEEIGLQYGFIRNPYMPSGKAMEFPVDHVATILLQLRGIFGVSARAETLLALLNKDICKIQEIADISGFAWKSIQDVLSEMTAAGFTATCDGEKRGRYYFLKSPEKAKKFFGVQDVKFPDWRHVFDVFGILWKTVSNPRLAALSESTFASEMNRIFAEEIGETLLNAGLDELKFLNSQNVESIPEILAKI